MRSFLFLVFASAFCALGAQTQYIDSLAGFDMAQAVLEAHQRNFDQQDLKIYVRMKQRVFLQKKYGIGGQQPAAQLLRKSQGGPTISNLPCVDEGFEGLGTGVLSSTAWTVTGANIGAFSMGGVSIICPTAAAIPSFVSAAGSTVALVVATPVTDANCNNVPTSPFGGSNVLLLNKPTGPYPDVINTRVTQNFSVTPSNFIYQYAYKAFANGLNHACCDAPNFIFNFYDCAGNLISALCDTLTQGQVVCPINYPTSTWSVSLGIYTAFTPSWVVNSVNLLPYLGSCVTVEVITSGCTAYGHMGYCYYDANCSSNGIISIDQQVMTADSYTSCNTSAVLSALPGFSNYSWQGPSGSGVSGATGTSVAASVSGNYTVTASTGSIVSTQTINLFVNTYTTAILGPGTICKGDSLTLQIVGTGLATYSWSNGAQTTMLYDKPFITTSYTVSIIDSLGCARTNTMTVTVLQPAAFSVQSPSPSICAGQSAVLTVTSTTSPITYSWSTGTTGPSVSVSPSVTAVFQVTAVTTAGCKSANSVMLTINQLPPLQLVAASPTLCTGAATTLSVVTAGNNAIAWSNGSIFASINVSPTVTAVYSASVTDLSGCESTATDTIQVYPLPQIQLSVSNSLICVGQVVDLAVTGSDINVISWNTGASTNSIITTPSVSTTYSVLVTSAQGCFARQSQQVQVSTCTGLQTYSGASPGLQVFPNPANGSFMVVSNAETEGQLLSETGQQLAAFSLRAENAFTQRFEGYAPGIYIVTTNRVSVKVVVLP